MDKPTRRRVLEASAVGSLGVVGLAGCLGGGDDENGNESGPDNETDDPDNESGPDNETDDATPGQQVDTYLTDLNANGYEGTDSIEDRAGEESVTIEVGAGDNGLAFSPVAVRVDAGTTITWEWVDVSAGGHNVAVNEGPASFESEVYSSTGETFTQTLNDEGAYRYQCDPHSFQGMHGAIIVE